MSTNSVALPQPASTMRWLTFLCLTLLGYALFGRGWAYLGRSPVFVGETVLVLGMVSFAICGWHRGLLEIPAVWCLLMLVTWGLLRTLPDVTSYGTEALRDSVIWAYSAFAFVVCGSILAEPSRLLMLLRRYGQFAMMFPLCVPLVWVLCRFFDDAIPRWPGTNIPILDAKGGDMLVHLGGIFAFGVAGFGGRIGPLRALLVAGCVAMLGAFDRAGLFSFLAIFAICFFHKPLHSSLWRLMWLGLAGAVLLSISGIRIQMPGRDREISVDQLVANVLSIGGSTKTGDLDDTKEWRLQWWGDIVDYTINGKYFWTGKGFGISLAEEDGYYDGRQEPTLRSPHSAHLTMLARGGVPGLAMWVLVHVTWGCSILGAYLRSRRLGDRRWSDLFMFLLAYWTAFLFNASFDVFLEGPMGGIWFWTIYGVGLAALWLYRYRPTILEDDDTAESLRSQPAIPATGM
jgi:hypothetical protein